MAKPGAKKSDPQPEAKHLGPVPKEHDPALIEKLASIGCNQKEIATMVGCSEDTLQRRFSEEMKRGWDKMKVSIKRAQYQVGVENKNVTMLIWLGKQHLGQSDTAGNRPDSGGGQLKSLFDALMAGPVPRGKSIVNADGSMKTAAPTEEKPANAADGSADAVQESSEKKPPEGE
jgi:hypothetical protein